MSNVVQFKARQKAPPQYQPEPGLYIYLPTMPQRIHRWTMRLIFGWRVTNGVENR